MSRGRKAQVLTVAVLGLAFAIAIGHKQLARFSASRSQPGAQEVIYTMLDAARAGDVPAYLANYAGEMRSSLEQSVRETGQDRFSRYLKESNAAIKGVVVSEPQAAGDGEMKVRVEYIYQERNEAQTLYLEGAGGKWKITRVDGSEPVKTLIPYGTPVQ
jgi:hypothetical protein